MLSLESNDLFYLSFPKVAISASLNETQNCCKNSMFYQIQYLRWSALYVSLIYFRILKLLKFLFYLFLILNLLFFFIFKNSDPKKKERRDIKNNKKLKIFS